MPEFCTIITPDFLPFAGTLYRNLRSFDAAAQLHVLAINEGVKTDGSLPFRVYSPDALAPGFVQPLLKKYGHTNDALRWSLKPVFLLHLLAAHEKVIYLDCDLFFFHPYRFLFDELDEASLLLTPHWAPENPFEQEEKFRTNFLIGLYNAGFVGAGRNAIPSLEWWATVCLYKTEIETDKGFFVDQRYLDLLPVLYENVKLLRHRGCNVGSWNIESNKRSTSEGKVWINERYPVVFVHFNHETIRHILNGNDRLLLPLLRHYEAAFAETGKRLQDFVPRLSDWKKTGAVLALKRRLTLRSRLKRFLYKLASEL